MGQNELQMSPDDFHVGQSIWFVASDQRMQSQNGFRTVEKIGRRWVSISQRNRFDPKTGLVDGGQFSSPGRVYLYKEDWEAQQEKNILWDALRKQVTGFGYSPPSVEAVQKAAEALGIELPTTPDK